MMLLCWSGVDIHHRSGRIKDVTYAYMGYLRYKLKLYLSAKIHEILKFTAQAILGLSSVCSFLI